MSFLKKNISPFHFIVCHFGFEKIENKGRIKNVLVSLEMILPKSTIIIAISTNTQVDSSILNYTHNIRIERYINETQYSIYKKCNYPCFYFNGIRYKFYYEYLKSHPEAKYAIFFDTDTIFLKNPFDLLMQNPEEVHFMYDFYPISDNTSLNNIWFYSWMQLNETIKEKCGISNLNSHLNFTEIENRIPMNSGLMMGKRENLILICKLMADSFTCPGMFINNAEQGLLNYLSVSGRLNLLGIKFHGHTNQNGQFLSCPSLLTLAQFRNRIHNSEVYAFHHYQFLRGIYRAVFDKDFREKIDLRL